MVYVQIRRLDQESSLRGYLNISKHSRNKEATKLALKKGPCPGGILLQVPKDFQNVHVHLAKHHVFTSYRWSCPVIVLHVKMYKLPTQNISLMMR